MIKTKLNCQILTVLSDGSSFKNNNSTYINKFKFVEKDFKLVQFQHKQNLTFTNMTSKSDKFIYRKKLFK